MIVKNLFFIFSIVLLAHFLVPLTSHAQSSFQDEIRKLAIEASPEYPRPGQTVELSLNDYGLGTLGSDIIWYVDDVPVPASVNQRKAKIVAGEYGTSQVVSVEMRTSNGEVFTAEKNITPAFLDIILEPQTYTPPFYQGRSVPSIGSIVNATALYNFGTIDPESLVYTWRVNRDVIEGGPLRGGYKVNFEVPLGEFFTIRLEVSRPGGEILARRAIDVRTAIPNVEFYQLTDVYGVQQTALGSRFIPTGQTSTLVAAPYNLDSRVYNNPNVLTWSVDGNEVNPSGNPYHLTFTRQFSSGTSRVNFRVQSLEQFLQGARGQMNVTY